MIWTGWIPPAAAAAVAAQAAANAAVPVPIPKPTPPKASVVKAKMFEDWIDIDMVEKIIQEGNGLELKWLHDLIGNGIKIRNVTGRYLKVDRFLNRIEKARKLGKQEETKLDDVTEADIEKENPTFVPS